LKCKGLSLYRFKTSKIASETGKIASETGKIASETGKIASETGKIASETGKIASETLALRRFYESLLPFVFPTTTLTAVCSAMRYIVNPPKSPCNKSEASFGFPLLKGDGRGI